MPVPYPPPEYLPVTMCFIEDCCYRLHSTKMGQPICQQHGRMLDRTGRIDKRLNLRSVEYKYTQDGYPLNR